MKGRDMRIYTAKAKNINILQKVRITLSTCRVEGAKLRGMPALWITEALSSFTCEDRGRGDGHIVVKHPGQE
jgi:hypothetical protein